MNGFLGTGATFRADLNLVVQIAMGLALLVGRMLARRRQFGAHGICQASVMILNLALIGLIMWPSFQRQVIPQIPAGLKDSYYAVSTLHAALGTIAELLGLYVVLVAGTKILPEGLRFQKYKPWMYTTLFLWWVVIFVGIGTYYDWYIASASKPAAQPAAAAPATAQAGKVTVKIKNFEFEPKEVSVPAGTTVEWVDELGRHTVEADNGSFKSDTLAAGGKFEHKFDQPGTYPYFCGFHGEMGGKDMAGVIKVTPPAK
ncbi:MAG TPA: DUF420 domain-containing protein [Blastocatellia bacterium]|nr:DUF420 domain-containing protein [Blastocatellia bacterium]